ncbi:HAAS signaling domain-containing protein [Microbacterium arabinogalactanolyticum]|uniref:HAAS signaling domain-containing protein n=1 Tax=Microbacterium arabinogalactanolyticum TaxID=69365 RepID=UPI004043B4CA
MTEDDYLRSVERMLSGIAPAHRTAVIDDLRSHFADAEELGRPVEETIRNLGTPEEIADRAREEFGASSDAIDARAERAWRVLQGAATVSALIIGVAVGFIVPTHTIATSEGGDSVLQHLTILQNDGLWVALLLLIPAVFAAVPLVVARAARIAVAVICGMLLIAVSLIAVFTVGEFFLPVLLLSWASLIVWARLRGSGFGRGWRIAGGVLAAAPVLLSIGSLVGPFGFEFGQRRRYADYSEVGSGPSIGIEAPGWLLVGAIVALAVLIAIGYRWAGWALAAVGFVALITGLVAGSLLALLFVWLGGWWLTIGLAHAVTASRRA